jgi:uncharacterized protein (TIGR00645 family)
MLDRAGRVAGRAMFMARFVMVPIYLGLLAGLCLVAIKTVQKVIVAAPTILAMDTSETILAVLTLVDLSLVANLVLIVMVAGWDNFIAPLQHDRGASPARWMGQLDFNAVKLKLLASTAAIAAIQILETFVHIAETSVHVAMWQLGILLAIAVTGVLLAWMDRLGGNH